MDGWTGKECTGDGATVRRMVAATGWKGKGETMNTLIATCPECGVKMKCKFTVPVRKGRWRYREYRCVVEECNGYWGCGRTLEYPVGQWGPKQEREALAESQNCPRSRWPDLIPKAREKQIKLLNRFHKRLNPGQDF